MLRLLNDRQGSSGVTADTANFNASIKSTNAAVDHSESAPMDVEAVSNVDATGRCTASMGSLQLTHRRKRFLQAVLVKRVCDLIAIVALAYSTLWTLLQKGRWPTIVHLVWS